MKIFKKVEDKIKLYGEIKIIQYLYLNYFCKNIIRKGQGKIIPYKGAVIDFDKTSQIYLSDGDIVINANRLRGSKAETYLRMREAAVWNAEEGCELSYGSTIEVLKNARLDSGYFTMNSFATIVSGKHITIGKDVMIARNAIIFDSDFHEIRNSKKSIECSDDVTIGNHVWLGVNAVILKGVSIGDNSIVAANALITENISESLMVGNEKNIKILQENVEWKR